MMQCFTYNFFSQPPNEQKVLQFCIILTWTSQVGVHKKRLINKAAKWHNTGNTKSQQGADWRTYFTVLIQCTLYIVKNNTI